MDYIESKLPITNEQSREQDTAPITEAVSKP